MKPTNLPEFEQINKWAKEAKQANKTLILLVAGDSAAGKTTRTANFGYKKIITTTTRQIRPGEIDGSDYDFVSEEEFNELKNNNMFLETTTYGWNSYGTKKQQFEDQIFKKEPCYIILDVAGIVNLKNIIDQKYPNDFLVKAIYYYVDKDTFLKRITSRDKSPNKEYINKRLEENEHAHFQIKNNSIVDLKIDASKDIKEFKRK